MKRKERREKQEARRTNNEARTAVTSPKHFNQFLKICELSLTLLVRGRLQQPVGCLHFFAQKQSGPAVSRHRSMAFSISSKWLRHRCKHLDHFGRFRMFIGATVSTSSFFCRVLDVWKLLFFNSAVKKSRGFLVTHKITHSHVFTSVDTTSLRV